MRAFVLLLTLAAAAGAAPRIETIDRATARRMLALARRAVRARQGATARAIFERILELDPDDPTARARLGYRRRGKDWERTAIDERLHADSDPKEAAEFRRRRYAEEARRADAVLEAGLEEHFVKLLDFVPRHAGVHAALGHRRIDGIYVRPRLEGAAKRLRPARRRWRALARTRLEPEPKGTIGIPGQRRPRPAWTIEDTTVSGALPAGDTTAIARSVPVAHDLLREIYGEDVETWSPKLLHFLPTSDYKALVRAHADPEQRALRMRVGTYRTDDFTALWVNEAEYAKDLYAHCVGFYSLQQWVTPGDATLDWRAYAWIKEGSAYLVTLEMFGSARSWFFSTQESSRKLRFSVPPPRSRTRGSCLRWVKTQMLDGTADGLRGVFGRTLNSLDLLTSLQAWTFVEFLAVFDPDGLRRLPRALRARDAGAYADRADRALQDCFGMGTKELEPLWRAFVLEVME